MPVDPNKKHQPSRLRWAVYTRKGGLLHDVERGRTPSAPIAQGAPA